MKLLRYLILPFFALVISYMVFLPGCSKDDDIKAKYDSQLLVSWIGYAYECPSTITKPPACPFPEESPESCPCQNITSFSVTISNFMIRRVYEDYSVGDPFDFFQGRSYRFDLKQALETAPFITPDFAARLEASWYEVVSIQVDDFQLGVTGYPALEQELNDDMQASAILPMTVVPFEGRDDYKDPSLRRKFPLQEGWTRNMHMYFDCALSISIRMETCDLVEVQPGIFEYQFTYDYSFTPDVSIEALSASSNI